MYKPESIVVLLRLHFALEVLFVVLSFLVQVTLLVVILNFGIPLALHVLLDLRSKDISTLTFFRAAFWLDPKLKN
jgi:hypothetical protein